MSVFFDGFLLKLEKLNCDRIFLKKFPFETIFSFSSGNLSVSTAQFGVLIVELLLVDLLEEPLPKEIFVELFDKFAEVLDCYISKDFLLFFDYLGTELVWPFCNCHFF